MEIFPFLLSVARALRKHGPEGLLAIVLLGGFLWGALNGISVWALLIVLCVLWGGFLLRGVNSDRHEERMREIDVQEIETKGRLTKQKYRKPKATRGKR